VKLTNLDKAEFDLPGGKCSSAGGSVHARRSLLLLHVGRLGVKEYACIHSIPGDLIELASRRTLADRGRSIEAASIALSSLQRVSEMIESDWRAGQRIVQTRRSGAFDS
jgi:hypothetical protein